MLGPRSKKQSTDPAELVQSRNRDKDYCEERAGADADTNGQVPCG